MLFCGKPKVCGQLRDLQRLRESFAGIVSAKDIFNGCALFLTGSHPQAGGRSAVIYSLLLSCRRRGINPQSYLSDVKPITRWL